MRGIIMAGGTGSRFFPLTRAVNKHLLPVFDKPLVYFPLSILMLSGIREVLVIVGAGQSAAFRALLGDGDQFGIRLEFAEQQSPAGIADAFRIGARFLGGQAVALALGDNVLFGPGLGRTLATIDCDVNAQVFGYRVSDPRPYAVLEFDDQRQAVGIQEKPAHPRSKWVVPGLYFYPADVVDLAPSLRPSPRGELEITDVNQLYLDLGRLTVELLPRGTLWMDAGTPENLLAASVLTNSIHQRQGLGLACPEEIAWQSGWISNADLERLAEAMGHTAYGEYLKALSRQEG